VARGVNDGSPTSLAGGICAYQCRVLLFPGHSNSLPSQYTLFQVLRNALYPSTAPQRSWRARSLSGSEYSSQYTIYGLCDLHPVSTSRTKYS
jgi:hypothetical protein